MTVFPIVNRGDSCQMMTYLWAVWNRAAMTALKENASATTLPSVGPLATRAAHP